MAVIKVTPLCLSIFLLLFPKSQGSGMLERYRRDVGNECEFNRDCSEVCKNIQDASCVCVLGNCTITSHMHWFGKSPPKECNTYKDCKCKGRPDNCFCHEGRCDTKAWECHETRDCKRMKKCSGRACKCKRNQCQWDCDTVADCKKSYCNRKLGKFCKCENHVCKSYDKPGECEPRKWDEDPDIASCVAKGLCSKDQPCDCSFPRSKRSYCKKAHFVRDHGNCRNDDDCSKHVLMCQDKSCICKDIKSDPGIPKKKEKCLKEERASPRGCEKKAKYMREETRRGICTVLQEPIMEISHTLNTI